MKISGIVCEYNPFHNGHLYHIEKTKENGATHIVAVMSGNFVQRGDTAITDKISRARLAVKSGADLVIELPVQYCLAPAENFAAGAVWLLDSLGVVDEISFGSEIGDISRITHAMETSDRIAEQKKDYILDIMEKGYTYPRALYSAVSSEDEDAAAVISEPNNLLAVEYIRALKNFSSDIKPFTVKRQGALHDGLFTEGVFASASFIRERIANNKPIGNFTPDVWTDAIYEALSDGKIADLNRLERVILYKLRTSSAEEIASLPDVGQGLEYRIKKAAVCSSLDELLCTIKTKRYTMARIRRILLSLLIGIRKEDTSCMPAYGRILAFNENGREILAAAKNKTAIPFATSLAKLSEISPAAQRSAELEKTASDIYGLALNSMTSSIEDIRAKIMIDLE